MKKFKLEILLKEHKGLIRVLAEKLWLGTTAVYDYLQLRDVKRKQYSKMLRYTDAFNSIKNTSYSWHELFTLVDEEQEN
jgi:hypothetical protein